MLNIRPATLADLPAITEIYNEAIRKTVATFDTEPKTPEEQMIWFADHGPKYPILVADENGIVVGWASLSKWSDRCAYSDTAEISLYVHEDHQGKGIGTRLVKAMMTALPENVPIYLETETAGNVRFYEGLGFRVVKQIEVPIYKLPLWEMLYPGRINL